MQNGILDASESSIAPRKDSDKSGLLNFVSVYGVSGSGKPIRTKADVTPFHTQGLDSRMYEIYKGHWPCQACMPQKLGSVYPALAKKHVRRDIYNPEVHRLRIEKERKGLGLVCVVPSTCITC
jgi:hypothetical protein